MSEDFIEDPISEGDASLSDMSSYTPAVPSPEQSLAKRMITVMDKGWLDTSTPDSAAAPVTSREWRSRKAKEEAKRFFVTPTASITNLTASDIWGHVLRAEGGYANNPADPGGETKFGISKRSYPNEDIHNLTAERAQEIFKSDFYDAVGGDTLLKLNPGLAAHVSDMAFNAGPKAAIKLMYDATGLTRQSQITPELIDAINTDETIIKDYSVARLKYYASLGNAPTFIKGWTNRINNLNKSLGVKSGLNGAYRAAKALDVDALVQHAFGAESQLLPRFKELDDQEITRLKHANEMLSPGYKKPEVTSQDPSAPESKKLSSLGEVFKATYDAKFYTNTVDGMNHLVNNAAYRASEANRKAMGDKFDKGMLEKMTFGVFGGVDDLQSWQTEIDKFKKEHPEVKLPYENTSQIYADVQRTAKGIEDKYNKLDSGSFTDSPASALHKLGHVVAGYLPGELMGSFSDRTEGTINLASAAIPGVGSVGAVAKGMLGAMLGTGATQAVVQPKRQEIGLEGGLAQGIANTAAATAAQGALGVLGSLGKKLWEAGSKEAATEIFKTTGHLKKVLNSEIPDATRQQLLRSTEDMDSFAKEIMNNPYGDSKEARILYENQRASAMSDVVNELPVRDMPDVPVQNVIDRSEKLHQQISGMFQDENIPDEMVKAYKDGADEWTKFKLSKAEEGSVANLEVANQPPKYLDPKTLEPQHAYNDELATYLKTKLTDLDKRYETNLGRVSKLDPESTIDIGETDASHIKVSEVMKEFEDTRTGLKEMFSCMVGGPSAE